MRAAVFVGQGDALGFDVVAGVAQLLDAGSGHHQVQVIAGGDGIHRAGVQALQ